MVYIVVCIDILFKTKSGRVLLQRLFIYIFGTAVLLAVGLYAAPFFIDLNKYKDNFSAIIKNFTGLQPEIAGDVHVSFFPRPSIEIGVVSIPNIDGAASHDILSADAIQATFTFASILKGKLEPTSITLLRPHLELEQMQNGDKNWVKLFANTDKSVQQESLNKPLNITINNGIISYRIKKAKTSVEYISGKLEIDSIDGPFDFSGQFLQGGTIVKFVGNVGKLSDNSEANLNINTDFFNFDMKGKYRQGKNFDIRGDTHLNIKDLSKFVDSFLSENPLLSKIKSNEVVDVKGSFLTSNEITSFNNLSIESESLKGKGNVDILYSNKKDNGLQWDISLNIDKINTDSLRKSKNKSLTDVINYYTAGMDDFNLSSYRFDIPSDISALFSLSISEIIYNGDKAANISIDTDIFNGKVIVHSFSAQLPGNSKVEFVGNVDNNGTRPLLTGKIRAYGDNFRTALTWIYPQYSFIPQDELKEFLFSCELNATPRKITISNIYGSVDKSLLNAFVFIRPSDNIPSIKADITLDRVDFDRYQATKQIDILTKDFMSEAKNSKVDSSWLKLFNYKLALSINASDLVYNGNNIKNLSTSIVAVKGVMNVQNISIDSDLLELHGKVNVDFHKDDMPIINVEIASKNFDTSAFIINPEKNEELSAIEKSSIWSQEPFNLMGIDRFTGTLNVSFDKFKHKTSSINKIKIIGDLKKNIFAIKEFTSQIGDFGKVSIKGNFGVSSEAPSMGISVTTSAISIQDLLELIGSDNTIQGQIYSVLVLKTFGLSPFEWINELKVNARIAMRNVQVNGINIPMIIEKSRSFYSVIDMDSVIQTATKEGTTTFSAIDGNIITDKSILQTKDLALSTDKSRGIFAGNISLHSLKVKGLAQIKYLPEIGKQVTLTVKLDGTIPDSVTYKLDSTNLAQYITSKANK